jgi:hypothetical protein
LNCRKAWKYSNEFGGLSAKSARPFKSLPFHAVSYRPEPTDSAGEQHIDST